MKDPIYIITQKDVRKVINPADSVSIIEKAFELYGHGLVQMPAKVYMFFPKKIEKIPSNKKFI